MFFFSSFTKQTKLTGKGLTHLQTHTHKTRYNYMSSARAYRNKGASEQIHHPYTTQGYHVLLISFSFFFLSYRFVPYLLLLLFTSLIPFTHPCVSTLV